MPTCQCGHTDFLESPLLHNDTTERSSGVGAVYSRIAHRTEDIQTIYEAWTKLETMKGRVRYQPSLNLNKTSEEIAEDHEKAFYNNLTSEGKAWYDAAGRWPWRGLNFSLGKKNPFGNDAEMFHLPVSLHLRMCTSCGTSTIHSNIEEHNQRIDALLPLAKEKLASISKQIKAEEKAKEAAMNERQSAEERVNELKKQLAEAEQAHDSANQRVGDGKKNLSNQRGHGFNPFSKR